jgi:hypothetical protein
MKLAPILALLTAAVCARPLLAYAIAACNNNDGFSPRAGTELPPHPRLLSWCDDCDSDNTYVARIDGQVVPTPTALKDLVVAHGERLFVLAAPVFGWELVDALRKPVPTRPRGA